MTLLTVENLIAFLTLSALEIVLGIDNIVFIAIISNALPHEVQSKARRIGPASGHGHPYPAAAWHHLGHGADRAAFDAARACGHGSRCRAFGRRPFSHRQVHLRDSRKNRAAKDGEPHLRKARGFGAAVTQIALLDIVFSLDSVITAVGMSGEIVVMVAAVVAAVAVMMAFADPVSHFVSRHPTVQMLALSFLILIGVFLVAEGLGRHIDRGYIYFAMGFSLLVELLNLRARKAAGS
jgi:predicted tellurium resistance membrane protein TerC